MSCPCPCGADLVNGDSRGYWTISNVTCEYRTCQACLSTRAFMYPYEIEGKTVHVFHDPLAKESAMSDHPGYESILDALMDGPISDVCELRRDGVVVARAFVGIDGVVSWMILPPEDV